MLVGLVCDHLLPHLALLFKLVLINHATNVACVGLVSQALAPSCKKIVGVDISQGMVDWYNTRVANQGLDPEEMKAVCVELKGERQPDELDGVKFDVVIVSRVLFLSIR